MVLFKSPGESLPQYASLHSLKVWGLLQGFKHLTFIKTPYKQCRDY